MSVRSSGGSLNIGFSQYIFTDCTQPSTGYIAALFCVLWVQTYVLFVVFAGNAAGPAKSLVYLAQVSLLFLPPSGVATIAISLFTIQPQFGTLCLFPRSVFGAFIQDAIGTPFVSLFLVLATSGVYAIVFRVRGLAYDTNRWLWRPLCAFVYNAYLPITKAAFEMLACRDVAGLHVFARAPQFLCRGAAHLPFFAVAVLLVILVACGVPLAAMVVLARLRQQGTLDDHAVNVGYWYSMYKPGFFWWDLTLCASRLLLAAIYIGIDLPMKVLAMAMVCAVAVAAQYYFKPHKLNADSRTEFLSLFVVFVIANIVAVSPQLSVTQQYFAQIAISVLCLSAAAVLFVVAGLLAKRRHVPIQLATDKPAVVVNPLRRIPTAVPSELAARRSMSVLALPLTPMQQRLLPSSPPASADRL